MKVDLIFFQNKNSTYFLKTLIDHEGQVSILEHSSNRYDINPEDGDEESDHTLLDVFPIAFSDHELAHSEYILYRIIEGNDNSVVFALNMANDEGGMDDSQCDEINSMIGCLLPEFEDQLEFDVRPNEHVISLLPNQSADDVIKILKDRLDSYGVIELGGELVTKQLTNRQMYEMNDETVIKNKKDSYKARFAPSNTPSPKM